MAASLRRRDARPAAKSCCKFELKEYRTVFTCSVCMMDSYETKRYRCNHCNLARHEHCIQLNKTMELVDSRSTNSHSRSKWAGKVFELHDKPQIRGRYSSTQNWARHCMVCGMLIKHYSYHYLNKEGMDINMHPYCAYLARSSTHKLTAEKLSCLWCSQEQPNGACIQESYCWSYCLKRRDRDNEMHIHVYCYSEMVIQALKGIVPSELGNNRSLRIVLQRKGSHIRDGSIWQDVAKEAIGLALDQLLGGGGGLLIPIISWVFH